MPIISAAVKSAYASRKAGGSSAGNYLNPSSIGEGDKCRVTFLGEDSVAGWEAWVDSKDGTKRIPLRFTDEPSAEDLATRAAEQNGVVGDAIARPFYAFAVWNYEAEAVQVFQFSQQSLATPLIGALSDEEVEAEVTLYDFVISATGRDRDKRYSVLPMPGKRRTPATDKKVADAWQETLDKGFDISVLLSGGDPFKGTPF
jgi:hypothetical protein